MKISRFILCSGQRRIMMYWYDTIVSKVTIFYNSFSGNLEPSSWFQLQRDQRRCRCCRWHRGDSWTRFAISRRRFDFRPRRVWLETSWRPFPAQSCFRCARWLWPRICCCDWGVRSHEWIFWWVARYFLHVQNQRPCLVSDKPEVGWT